MQKLISDWQANLNNLKVDLYNLGERGDSMMYNVLSAEALAIATCIIDLQAHSHSQALAVGVNK